MRAIAWCLAVVLASAPPATAATPSGVDVTFGYVGEWLYNATGGTRSTDAYADQLMIGVDVDLEEAWGWHGGLFRAVVTNRNGPQLDAEAGLGTLLETHEIYGRGHYTRLTRFYLQQALWGDRLVLKLGRGDIDFFPLTCHFINISFCGALPGYHSPGWYTWPISQDFVNATFWPTKQAYIKAGVAEVNPNNLDGDQGLHLHTPASPLDGTLVNVEAGWLPMVGENLEGTYIAGYWRDSTSYKGVRDGSLQDTSTGHYAMMQQDVHRASSGAVLRVFANYSRADPDVSQVDRLISTGLWYTGIFASRPHDRLGLVYGQNRGPLGSERPLEFNYEFGVVRGLRLMPSVQYVRDPGGGRDLDNALVYGIKLMIDLPGRDP